jgi:hypothetical protein
MDAKEQAFCAFSRLLVSSTNHESPVRRGGGLSPFTFRLSPLTFLLFPLRPLRPLREVLPSSFLCVLCALSRLLNLPQRWDKAHLLELIKEPE